MAKVERKDQAKELFLQAAAKNEFGLERQENDDKFSHKSGSDNDDDGEDDENAESLDDNESDPDFPIGAYFLLNLLMIFVGIVGICLTSTLHLSHEPAEKFLLIAQINLHLPPYLLYTVGGLSVVNSLLALIFLFAESSAYFFVVPHINGLIVALCCMASVSATGGWYNPDVRTYQRFLEADAFSRYTNDTNILTKTGEEFHHHDDIERASDDDPDHKQDQNDHYWDTLQSTLKCCGLDEATNWINSICKCIPSSCCIDGKEKECKNRIELWNTSTSTYYQNFSYVKDHLWPKNCLDLIKHELMSLKRDWISFPLILFFFYMILIFNINFIVVAVRNRYNINSDFRVIQESKIRLKTKFKACCCFCCNFKRRRKARNQVGTEGHDNKLEKPNHDDGSKPNIETLIPARELKNYDQISNR